MAGVFVVAQDGLANHLRFFEQSDPTQCAPNVLVEAPDLIPERNHHQRFDLLGEISSPRPPEIMSPAGEDRSSAGLILSAIPIAVAFYGGARNSPSGFRGSLNRMTSGIPLRPTHTAPPSALDVPRDAPEYGGSVGAPGSALACGLGAPSIISRSGPAQAKNPPLMRRRATNTVPNECEYGCESICDPRRSQSAPRNPFGQFCRSYGTSVGLSTSSRCRPSCEPTQSRHPPRFSSSISTPRVATFCRERCGENFLTQPYTSVMRQRMRSRFCAKNRSRRLSATVPSSTQAPNC